MPILVEHPGPIQDLYGMAANAGGFATGQALHANGLQDAASARADDAQAIGVYGELLRDQQLQDRLDQQEKLAGQRDQGALQRADLTGQYGVQKAVIGNQGRENVANIGQAGANQRASYNADAATGRNDANIESRNRNADLQNGLGYDRLGLGYDQLERQKAADQQRAQMQQERLQEQRQVEQIKTAEQAARAQNRLDQAAKLRQVSALISETQRQRNILEARARANGGALSPEAHLIGPLNDRIKQIIEQTMGPVPAPTVDNLAPMLMEQGGLQPVSYQQSAPQPQQAAPPQHITDGGGVVWVFTGQFDPRSGEPLYQEQR